MVCSAALLQQKLIQQIKATEFDRPDVADLWDHDYSVKGGSLIFQDH